jgi:fatty acid desaturase
MSEAARAGALTDTEREVSQRLSQGFAWPTVLLLVALIAIEGAVIAAWAVGAMPLLLGMFINSVACYGLYTVVHDSVHKAVSNRNPKYARWDTICGNVAAQLILLSFSGHRSSHLRHHAHTNTDRDPDLAAKGPLMALPIKWLASNVIVVLVALPGGVQLASALKRRLGGDATADTDDSRLLAKQSWAARVGVLAVLISIPLGAVVPVVVLWIIPARLTFLYLLFFFVWLPHDPYEHADRFRNTRITLFPGSTWLLLQQDRHLIHHLYPSIPWYRYRAAHRELASLLRESSAVVAGPSSDPRVRVRLR